jgi:hypothetical protein
MQVNVATPDSVQQMRATIAPVNEQIKKEVGADIWQAVQDELAALRKKGA